ncbi:MAG: hypothetical protein SPE18_12355 [Candidatus Limivicinus sp.]|nr:hypothetical protein [Candidatus Limivicinus sp.]
MKDLNDICKLSDLHLTGNETFTLNGSETDMTILEYWRWHYSEIFDLQDTIAEYIVGKALGLTEAQNVGSWTLFDMLYRNKRIEVKETSYYHAWQTDEEKKSPARVFSITKSYSRYQDNTSTFERQNDIYIFCLNTGETRKDSNPLQLEHWEFYVIPTAVINRECSDGKTISLSRVRKIASPTSYNDLKEEIDRIIETE